MDFNQPLLEDDYPDMFSSFKERDEAIAKLKFTSDTNVPSETLRYNRTNRVWEEFNGSSWVEKRVEPPGIIKAYGGSTAPRGHLMCNGDAVSRTTYADLYAIIGTNYGTGDGSSTFNLPDLRQRFPLGKAGSGTGSSLGQTGGSIDHTHSVPAHYHSMGSGADLAIGSSGSHTTTIDIAHGHTASSNNVTTGITATTGSSTVSLTDPGHGHNYGAKEGGSNGSGANRPQGASSSSGSNTSYSTNSTSTGITLNNGTHSHTVSISDSGHSHTITVNALGTTNKTDTDGTHSHSSGAFSGKIGLVTGGVDGNAAMTSGANNPPFLVVNYIITI